MIKTETRDRIATIELSRLDKKNALTTAMYAAMTESLAAAESDPGVRAILIHGARDCFTAGNDLKDFLEGPAGASQALRFVSALSKVGKPVVAAVAGWWMYAGYVWLTNNAGANWQMRLVVPVNSR